MAEILHKLSINAPRERIYEALSTRQGLEQWWTTTTDGISVPDELLTFRFGEHAIEMRVTEMTPGHRVAWECTKSGPEWVGTKLSFELTEENGKTTLHFGHRGWADASDFYSHCSMRWAMFLLSLRELAETGKGRPFPYALPI